MLATYTITAVKCFMAQAFGKFEFPVPFLNFNRNLKCQKILKSFFCVKYV